MHDRAVTRPYDALVVSEARTKAIVDSALDCVVTMDAGGRIVEWNPAAERCFGYTSAEVVGREMADLIIPYEMRDAHREGLARYLATGEARMLDRRIETTAVRADGTEFPIEIAIARIDVPGEPVFTGHLRDITERREAEEEVRASRARLVEVADEARRRLERDLHDGAQQRLVGLALDLQLARETSSTIRRRLASCSTARSRACARRSTSCASSRAGSIPPCSRPMDWPPRCPTWPGAARSTCASTGSTRSACRPQSRPPSTSCAPRR